MDQPVSDTQDTDSFDSSWESAEEDLIPIENDHLTEDVREAEQRADAQLEADAARLEESIKAFDQEYGQETLVEPDVPQEIESEPVEEIVDEPPPAAVDDQGDADSGRHVTFPTELGYDVHSEGGGIEAPNRVVWNNTIETESESGGGVERLG
jgi:hypothetical protein